jgi:arylsulfatase A-like enzyme
MSRPNVVVVVLDSLRRDHVGAYGSEWVETEALDAFAADSNTVTFTEAYPEALPTIPVREGLMTGDRTLPTHFWEPIDDDRTTLPELLRRAGYVTSLVTDNYHMAKPGMNYHRGFDGFRWIRGQENDAFRTAPGTVDLERYVKPEMEGSLSIRGLEQYLRNTADRDDDESEFFAAQVFRAAVEWLDRNGDHDPFFLWVDSFDPHEPWDPPPAYRGRYTDPDYDGPDLIKPKDGPTDWLTDDELAHVHGRYREEVEYVDAWFGEFVGALRERELYEESLVVVLSDHGVALGDHGVVGKPPWSLHGEVVELPLFVKLPAGRAADADLQSEVDALVQTHDVPATVLDLIGLGAESRPMDGRSLAPLLAGDRDRVRDAVVTGFHPHPARCVRDDTWSYVSRPEGMDDGLYRRADDPTEDVNLLGEYPEVAERLDAVLGEWVAPTNEGPFSPQHPTVMERSAPNERAAALAGSDLDEAVEERLSKLGYYQ